MMTLVSMKKTFNYVEFPPHSFVTSLTVSHPLLVDHSFMGT